MVKRNFKFAPLSGFYMAISIIGVLISLIKILPSDETWGVTLTVIFGVMLVASLISMTVADPDTFIELEKKS